MLGLSGGETATLALTGVASAASIIENKRRRKQLAQLRRSMLEQVDAGASSAKGVVGQQARLAAGGATQDSINRGFYNSTVASDAQSGILQNAGADMGNIDARAGEQRAQVLADTFDQSGGADLSGVGRVAGMILGNQFGRDGESNLNASQVSQAAGQAPAVMQTGGNPTTNSGMYDSVYDDNGPDLEMDGSLADRQIASAQRRRGRKWTY